MSLFEETSSSAEQAESTTISEEASSDIETTAVSDHREDVLVSSTETEEASSNVEATAVSDHQEDTLVSSTDAEEASSNVEATAVSDHQEDTLVSSTETTEAIETPRDSLTKKIWSIGVRHVVFMALGAALYAGLSYVTNTLQLPGASNVSLRPAIVIPLFFGSVFGPWVGLFTGAVGNSINDLLQGGFWWNWELGAGLIGFIPGLVLYFTRGRYNNALRIILAEIFSVIGLVVGLAFSSITDIWVAGSSFTTVIATEFWPALLPDLVLGIVLLAILLVAYNAALGRSGRV